MAEYTTEGQHVVADAYNAKESITLVDVFEAARKAKMTVLKHFQNENSIMLLLAESHLTVHRRGNHWFFDCYTCGETAKPLHAIMYLVDKLDANPFYIHSFPRGRA